MKWIEIKVTTTTQATEAVEGIMYEMGVGGLYIQDPRDVLADKKQPTDWDYLEEELRNIDPEEVIIRAYLPEHTSYMEQITLLKEKLKIVQQYFDIGKGEIQLSEVFENDWANAWKKYYKPVKVGQKVVIKPTWEGYELQDSSEVVVEMDPGMAFGTGTHETTKMCIQLLENYVSRNSQVLDIGCGSGILGITALKLGAQNCMAVDIDENAVRVAKENARVNNVSDKMDSKAGNLVDIVIDTYDVVVANIIADIIIHLSGIVKPFLKENGVFIASGIINDRYEEVKENLLKNGFAIKEESFMGEWVAVAVTRREYA